MIRRHLRKVLPPSLRVRIAAARRGLRDRRLGLDDLMVAAPATRADFAGFAEIASVEQPIRRSAHWEGKLHNLRTAAARLDGVVLPPGAILSFWAVAGRPDAANGYRVGRSIRADVLGADVGGGLCQISGLAYELGLRAGLDIVERHPHTQDLYTEATRFTPLGLDATVVWAHKDMRLRNTLGEPVAFTFEVGETAISGRVLARATRQPARLSIELDDRGPRQRIAQVFRERSADRSREFVSRDVYAVSTLVERGPSVG